MTSAAEMANDAEREVAVLTAERDELKLQLEEAQAVIDETRKARDGIDADRLAARARYSESASSADNLVADVLGLVVARLNWIDGL